MALAAGAAGRLRAIVRMRVDGPVSCVDGKERLKMVGDERFQHNGHSWFVVIGGQPVRAACRHEWQSGYGRFPSLDLAVSMGWRTT